MRLFKRFLLVGLFVVSFGSIAHALDTVTTTTIRNAGGTFGGTYTFLFSNNSDGTGESAVVKVSTAALAGTPSRLKITKLKWNVSGMFVNILFDASTDDRVVSITGQGELSEADGFEIKDPRSSGATGNILFTTVGHSSGDGYNIFMEVKAVQ